MNNGFPNTLHTWSYTNGNQIFQSILYDVILDIELDIDCNRKS